MEQSEDITFFKEEAIRIFEKTVDFDSNATNSKSTESTSLRIARNASSRIFFRSSTAKTGRQ